jgi:hypothetical protein
MTPILSEYQEGTRNARIYRTAMGQWGVITFDSETDFNGFEAFNNEDDADVFAEGWVKGYDSV